MRAFSTCYPSMTDLSCDLKLSVNMQNHVVWNIVIWAKQIGNSMGVFHSYKSDLWRLYKVTHVLLLKLTTSKEFERKNLCARSVAAATFKLASSRKNSVECTNAHWKVDLALLVLFVWSIFLGFCYLWMGWFWAHCSCPFAWDVRRGLLSNWLKLDSKLQNSKKEKCSKVHIERKVDLVPFECSF